jgi:hypothetical protein
VFCTQSGSIPANGSFSIWEGNFLGIEDTVGLADMFQQALIITLIQQVGQ